MPLAIIIVRGKNVGQVYPLIEAEPVTIGRDKSNQLRLKDRKLSRIHAQLEVIDGRCQLIDLNSTNGTSVNGKPVEDNVWLSPNDEVEIGITVLRLTEISPAEASLAETDEARRVTEEEASGLRCAECGCAITEEDVAAGNIRHVGERFYCQQCVASFEPATLEASPLDEEPDAPSAPLLEADTKIAGIRIIAPLGESRIGRVYRAEQGNMGREVAFKLLSVTDNDWAQKYLNAVYASGQLVHSNIALIFDTGEDDGRYYLVREYVEGESLEERLGRKEPFTLPEAHSIIIQATHALEHGAESHLFHGSLSPRKILVDADGSVVKLVGFGLPQTAPHGISLEAYRRHSLPYTPPERLEGMTTPNFASDVYSLIAVFYHMITGRPPFRGSSPAALMRRIRTKEPRALSEYLPSAPATAQHIVNRALAKEPGSRYQNAKELLFDLEDTLRREL
jgi:Protein kinase domain/FHA domain